MVENLIAGYLSTGKRLVIPELGAFLKKETGEVVFVEYLKKDDGVFTGVIAQSLGIPVGEAARQAAGLTATVREALASKGFFIVPNLGTMRRDASGAITLATTVTEEPMRAREAATPPPAEPKVVQYAPPKQQVKVEHYTRGEVPAAKPPRPVTEAQPVGENRSAPAPEPLKSRPTVAATPVTQAVPASATAARQPVRETANAPSPRPNPVAQNINNTTARPQLVRPGPTETPGRPAPQRRQPVNVPRRKKKTDLVMIIAIVAALVAIGSMVYGLMVDNDPIMNIQPTSPVQETVQVQETAPEE